MVTANIDHRPGTINAVDRAAGLSHTASAYAGGAAVAVLFNTLLAWVKDSSDALNTAMAHTLGHHWTTHGVAVVLVFLVVGFILSRREGDVFAGFSAIYALVLSVFAAGLGLLGWFVFM
jgi:hypothetical protein